MARSSLLLLLLALSGCSDAADLMPGVRHGRPDAPALAARDFLRLVKRERCERAFQRFTEQTRRDITLRSKAEVRNAPYYAEVFSPENLFCKPTMVNRFASYLPGTTSVAEVRGDTAVVTVMLREPTGFLLPGFFPTSHRDTPVQMLLVLEDGRWRVSLPGVYQPPPGGEPLEIGSYSVQLRPRADPADGRVSMRVAGPATMPASRLRDAFLDFDRWPELFPGIVEARALEPPRRHMYQRVYVRVRAPSGDEADFVADLEHASARVDTTAFAPPPGATARDSAAAAARMEAARNPVYFRVGWHIPQPDTFPTTPGVARIRTFGANLKLEGGRHPPAAEYSFTVDTTEWPAAFRGAFEPSAAARTLDALLAGALRHGRW